MTEHVDMAAFVEAKSDQLNSDDLLGGPRTITITKVTGNDGDQPISIHFQGDNSKPFKPCKTIRRVLLAIWGRNASDYVGRSMTLYRDDSVTFGGLNVGGIRISHMSHLEKETVVVVMKTKGKKAGIKVLPLKDAPATKSEVEPTQEAALAAITQAAEKGTTELQNVWKQKWLAPFRQALQADLDRLKAVAAAKDAPAPQPEATPPADTDPALASWLKAISEAADEAAVNQLDKDSEVDRGFFTQEQNDELDQALASKRDACRAEQAKVKEPVA